MATFEVTSDRDPSVIYTIAEQADGSFTCTCGDFAHRKAFVAGGECKHIRRHLAGRRYAGILDAITALEPLRPANAPLPPADASLGPNEPNPTALAQTWNELVVAERRRRQLGNHPAAAVSEMYRSES